MNATSEPSHLVMPSLVPGSHGTIDWRVEPGNDEAGMAGALVEC
jgi:hypothetical protein